MRSNRRTVVAIMIAASLALAAGPARSADKNDQKCLDAVGKAVQKYVATAQKELGKCRQKLADPSMANCDLSLPKIVKAATKRDKAFDKKCKKFDPVRAFGYTGCHTPGCESTDASADGYKTCIGCASGVAAGQLNRAPGACGNGFLDAGEGCDDGNTIAGDGCSPTCTVEETGTCGDGTITGDEQCDPPGPLAPSCGEGEICSDSCQCASVECGNGVVESGEECDPPGSTAGCDPGDVCNSRCECRPPCDCCALMPTQLQTTVKVASGTCGSLRNFRCSDDVNQTCGTSDDCFVDNGSCCTATGGGCIAGRCEGDLLLTCPGGDADCVVSTGTCEEQPPLGKLPLDLECGGLYTGGGSNSVPLPFSIPDTSTVLSKVLSCDPDTGQIVTSAVTQAEATQTTCSEGRKCSGSNASCVLDADCPMSETCDNRCLFGAPLPVPNPMTPPTSVCTINAVAEDLTGTGTCDGDSTVNVSLRSEVYLTGDLFQMSTPPNLPGVQPCPLCTRQCAGGSMFEFPCAGDSDCPGSTCTAATLCLGGPNDKDPCTPGTSDSATLGDTEGAFPTSHDCPPDPLTTITDAIGGLPIELEFTTATQVKQSHDLSAGTGAQRVFCGFCRDNLNGGTLKFEGDTSGGSPPAIPPADGNAVPCTSDADCQADTDTYESCAQRNPGAFSQAGSTVFSLTGTPAECLADGQPKAATAVGGFCIPPTFDATVDAAGDLPGPGAVSLAVEAQLLP